MIIVDVYNVLHVTGVLPPELAGLDVLGLAELVAMSRYGRQKALLVCDGFGSPTAEDAAAHAILRGREPSAADFQGILFAGRGRDADSLIEHLLARFGGTRTITVASNDRRIARAARGVKSRWIRSDDLLRELAADFARSGRSAQRLRPSSHNEGPLTRDEVDRWMREFGIEPTSPPVEPPRVAPPRDAPPVQARSKKPIGSAPAPATGPAREIDPLLVAALREWPGRISLDELDMAWWLGEDGPDPNVEKYR